MLGTADQTAYECAGSAFKAVKDLTGNSTKLTFSFTAATTGFCEVDLEFAGAIPAGWPWITVGYAVVFTHAGQTATGTIFLNDIGRDILEHDAATHTTLHFEIADVVFAGSKIASAHLTGSFVP
jgi:hypothetical protein